MTLFQLKSVSTFRLPSPRRPIYPFVVLALMVAIGFLWASQVQSGMDLRPILRLAAAASLLLALILAWNARLQNLYQALRESERSKSVLLANLPGMAYQCRCDPQWTMEFISQGCKELTGHPCEDLLYNRKLSFNDLIEPSFREDIWKAWQAAIDTGKSVQVEYPIRAADGSMKWVYEQGTPIRDAEGHVKFLEGLIIDITPRKAIEQELVAARRKAEDALRVKARFLAVMSHEIRTPLNGILGLSDMLLGNAADPEKARELRMIQESGRHLLHIINDILEFSHMDSGKVQLEVQAFLLTSLVENLHRTFAPLARQKGLSFSLEVDASIPERFLGDENRLRQVMTNLIANSITCLAD
jgi:PAS domain S-box-containing protein